MIRPSDTAAALIIATTMLASMCVAQSPGSPPDRIDLTFTIQPDRTACSFPVDLHITGKSKTFSLPGNRTVVTAPGENARRPA